MKNFFSAIFSFARDEDGLSLKDVTTLAVLLVWGVTVILGLINDYSGVKLDQYSMILESVTELCIYVVVSTLGLVAVQNISTKFGRRNDKVAQDNPIEEINEQTPSTIIDEPVDDKKTRSEDII